MLSLPKCAIIFLVVTTHVLEIAGVAEWQTQQTQNLPGATSCRFESGCRHPWQGQKASESLGYPGILGLFLYLLPSGQVPHK